jgi:hypothetical protein
MLPMLALVANSVGFAAKCLLITRIFMTTLCFKYWLSLLCMHCLKVENEVKCIMDDPIYAEYSRSLQIMSATETFPMFVYWSAMVPPGLLGLSNVDFLFAIVLYNS